MFIEPIYVLVVASLTNDNHLIYRPQAKEFIERLADHYHIVLYSSREPKYVSMVREHLDPSGSIVKEALDYRSCVRTQSGRVLKDIKAVVGSSLRDMVMVDYKVLNICRHLENGVCLLFYDPSIPEDPGYLLGEPLQYLVGLAAQSDVRLQNMNRLPYSHFVTKRDYSMVDATGGYLF